MLAATPNAWLTPGEAPPNPVAYRVFLPPGEGYIAAFAGAFLSLVEVENWEEHGDQAVETVADAFAACFDLSIPLRLAVEIGTIVAYGGSAAPAHWLACDGAAYNESDYAGLFAIIGATYGVGGAGTFRVPDMRGRAALGAGTGAGLTARALADAGGVESVTLTDSQMPAHAHSVHDHGLPIPVQAGAGSIVETASLLGTDTGSDGGDGSHENMMPFIALNFMIYAGV
jgi:microcystin-dependent protein